MAWRYVAKPMEFSLLFTSGLLLGLSCDARAHTGIIWGDGVKFESICKPRDYPPVTGESKFY